MKVSLMDQKKKREGNGKRGKEWGSRNQQRKNQNGKSSKKKKGLFPGRLETLRHSVLSGLSDKKRTLTLR